MPRMAGLKGEAGESPALPRNGNSIPGTRYWVSGIGKPGRPPLLTPLSSRGRGRSMAWAVSTSS